MLDVSKFADAGILCIEFRNISQEIEDKTKNLYRFVRAEKVNDKWIPYFLPECEQILIDISNAEKRLEEIEKDSIEFSNLMGEFKSIRELASAAHHENMKIQGAEKACRKILEKELVANHNKNPEEVLQMDTVRDQYLARDRVIVESKFDEFKSKMAACNRILEKY